MNPLWLDVIVGGIQDDEPFLGHVNVRGKSYLSNCVGTGFGNHLAIPLFREVAEKPSAEITQQEAEELVSSFIVNMLKKVFLKAFDSIKSHF